MNKIIAVPYDGHTLSASIYNHTSSTRKGCIFYFHGGGLVFGTSDDLPAIYLNAFCQAGYDFISLSYPLAPETGLTTIIDAAFCTVTHILEQPQLIGYDTMPPYFLFGRSAGAYLALATASRLVCPKPAGILSFYGYHTFDIPEFRKPSSVYQKLPAVPERIVTQLTNRGFLTEGPKETRYSIYIYARQTGKWPELLGSPEDITDCSLSDHDLSLLPPGFFTASSGDQDVPFRMSKYMASKVPGSIFKPVYYLEHDFDRDTKKKDGMQVYEAAILWMDKRLSSI